MFFNMAVLFVSLEYFSLPDVAFTLSKFTNGAIIFGIVIIFQNAPEILQVHSGIPCSWIVKLFYFCAPNVDKMVLSSCLLLRLNLLYLKSLFIQHRNLSVNNSE